MTYNINTFKQCLNKSRPIILDGGLSNELESQGLNLNSSLWSAEILVEQPQAIINAHLAYLNAGAQIITSASYQVSFPGFINAGFSKKQAENALLKSVELAITARNQYQDSSTSLVAASIGPYGAYLADGSEYSGNYGVRDEVLHCFHESRMAILDQSGADILACETIPSLQETCVLVKLIAGAKTPAWVSFSCRDSCHLNDGTLIEEALSILKEQINVLAVGVNCTAPQYVSELIDRIKQCTPAKHIIVYPNAGQIYNVKNKQWFVAGNVVDIKATARQWYEKGADIIGGCCGIGPQEINTIKNAFD